MRCFLLFTALWFGWVNWLGAEPPVTVPARIVAAARAQIGVTAGYDPAYVKLSYPGGDVPVKSGVCSDVVVRSLRTLGIDLQKDVHEDMKAAFDRYPKKWALKKPDPNIDHRRVANLMCFFERKHIALREKLPIATSYAPGDIVAWDLGGGVLHVGVVSDRKIKNVPLIIHNIGRGAQEEDVLLQYQIIGHYRIKSVSANDLAIIVSKAERRLEVFRGPTKLHSFRIGLGNSPIGDKERSGDGRTPEGSFFVCAKNPKSRFYLSLGISYPDSDDAARGLRNGLISQVVHDNIVSAQKNRKTPPWNTALGGEIFIHGNGSVSDWTLGCVALDDADMNILFDLIEVGTRVEIKP